MSEVEFCCSHFDSILDRNIPHVTLKVFLLLDWASLNNLMEAYPRFRGFLAQELKRKSQCYPELNNEGLRHSWLTILCKIGPK